MPEDEIWVGGWSFSSTGSPIANGSVMGSFTPFGEPDVDIDHNGRVAVAVVRRVEQQQEVVVQLFGADGVPRRDLLVVSPSPAVQQFDPRVSLAADGSFSVVWREFSSILVRRFDGDGLALPLGGAVGIHP